MSVPNYFRVTLPSGNPAVYEAPEHVLNEREGTTLAERVRWFAMHVATRFNGRWHLRTPDHKWKEATPEQAAAFDACKSAD